RGEFRPGAARASSGRVHFIAQGLRSGRPSALAMAALASGNHADKIEAPPSLFLTASMQATMARNEYSKSGAAAISAAFASHSTGKRPRILQSATGRPAESTAKDPLVFHGPTVCWSSPPAEGGRNRRGMSSAHWLNS